MEKWNRFCDICKWATIIWSDSLELIMIVIVYIVRAILVLCSHKHVRLCQSSIQDLWRQCDMTYNLLWPVFTTMIVVKFSDIEPPTSTQCTLVPFKLLVTLIIVNVETRSKAPRAEVLVKLNKVEFTVSLDVWAPSSFELIFLSMFLFGWCSSTTENLHLRYLAAVVLQFSSSLPPTWHTGAIIEGDSVSTPTSTVRQSSQLTLNALWCTLSYPSPQYNKNGKSRYISG